MILACPLCHARFLVSASLFAAGPRQVHCAHCRHGWRAEASSDPAEAPPPVAARTPDPEPAAPAKPQTIPLPEEPLPSWLRWSIRIGAAVILGVLFLGLVFGRQQAAKMWPFTEGVYNKIGLHIYHAGEGLGFEQVRSELRYNGGITQLIIEGGIHNETRNTQQIPDILASAVGPDGKIMQSWQIDAPAARVFAGETLRFRSTINAPRGTVTEINLVFIEPKNE